MTELIKAEAFEVFIMFYAGLTVMMIIELKNAVCILLKPNKRIEVFLEIVVWLIAAYLVGGFWFYCSYGKITPYGVGALAVGALLWKKLLYGIIIEVINKELRTEQTKGLTYAKEKRENSRIRKGKSRNWFRRSSRRETGAKRTS